MWEILHMYIINPFTADIDSMMSTVSTSFYADKLTLTTRAQKLKLKRLSLIISQKDSLVCPSD